MSTETVAGRKRKGASLAPLAPSKRVARASGGWAALPTDIVFLILRRVLAGGDIVDYIAFRGVCFYWRACTPPPGDPTLRDPRLRPRGWVALCDGDAVRTDDACEIPFFNTRTARRIRVHLPELRRYRIVGFTDGLVILLHKSTTKVRVVHPFTRAAVDLPPLVRVYRKEVGQFKYPMLLMVAVVCGSANSIAVAVWFPSRTVVLAAEPDDTDWKLYPPSLEVEGSPVVVAHIPDDININFKIFMVESGGQMLLAVYPPGHSGFRLYEVHLRLRNSTGTGELIRVDSLGDRALFLGTDRCLSVSTRGLPSLRGNSIYFSLVGSPVVLHPLGTESSEDLAKHCQIHNMVDRIRPSVRPFTIVDHLFTYCHPRQWAEGLMFHEYHHIPESFKELRGSIKAKNSKLRIPPR
ncbi:hypothetical protein ACQ4PT_015335 [Festuca glaucescens]